jgi:hypothetical protein
MYNFLMLNLVVYNKVTTRLWEILVVLTGLSAAQESVGQSLLAYLCKTFIVYELWKTLVSYSRGECIWDSVFSLTRCTFRHVLNYPPSASFSYSRHHSSSPTWKVVSRSTILYNACDCPMYTFLIYIATLSVIQTVRSQMIWQQTMTNWKSVEPYIRCTVWVMI